MLQEYRARKATTRSSKNKVDTKMHFGRDLEVMEVRVLHLGEEDTTTDGAYLEGPVRRAEVMYLLLSQSELLTKNATIVVRLDVELERALNVQYTGKKTR